jgi:hypothetical protein
MNHKGKVALIAVVALSVGALSLFWGGTAALSYNAVSGSFDGASVAEKTSPSAAESAAATEDTGDYQLSSVAVSK